MAMDILDLEAMDLLPKGRAELTEAGNKQQLAQKQVQTEQKPVEQSPSDGSSDSIPAALSEGEFVMPADVTSILGNGSTEAGARKLNNVISVLRDYYKATPSDKSPYISPDEFSKLLLQALGGQNE